MEGVMRATLGSGCVVQGCDPWLCVVCPFLVTTRKVVSAKIRSTDFSIVIFVAFCPLPKIRQLT